MDNNANVYIIPQEIKSEIMLIKGVYLKDIAIIFAIYFILDTFSQYVYEPIQLVYTVWTFLLGLILTRGSHLNPGKKLYHVILFKLCDSKKIYHHREPEIQAAAFVRE